MADVKIRSRLTETGHSSSSFNFLFQVFETIDLLWCKIVMHKFYFQNVNANCKYIYGNKQESYGKVQRTFHPSAATIENMGVNHGSRRTGMAEQCLDMTKA